MRNYSTILFSIHILQSRQGLVKLMMQFIMVGIQMVHKLQDHIMFQFVVYKDSEIEARQKVPEDPLIKLLQKSQRVQFAKILID